MKLAWRSRMVAVAWTVRHHVRRALRMGASAPWAVPALFTLAVLRGRVRLRVVALDSTRIGHFVPGAAAWAAWLTSPLLPAPSEDAASQRLPAIGARTITRVTWSSGAANRQWEAMAKRKLGRSRAARCLSEWDSAFPSRWRVLDRSDPLGDPIHNDLFLRLDGRLPFLPAEEAAARAWLTSLGWEPGDRWVCLLVRDPAYLATNSAARPLRGWGYHSYRDGDIASYRTAVAELLDAGFWVFRMGKEAARPLNVEHPRFIDYAFRPDRSDLLDVWLFAHCAGCISTGSGPDTIARVWRRPLLMVNLLPLAGLWTGCEIVTAPKALTWRESGRPLTLTEMITASYSSSEDYARAGIHYAEQSPEMIRDLVVEFRPWIAGEPPQPESDLQRRFWEYFIRVQRDVHGVHVNRSLGHLERVGEAWLRAQPAEFWD